MKKNTNEQKKETKKINVQIKNELNKSEPKQKGTLS